MSEMKTTITFAVVAAGLALLALFTIPHSKQPDAFFDVGKEFFPDFTDPNEALSLEVISFDEDTGEALPFKVEFKDAAWRIPSHENYPADGKDRLAKTAAGLIGIKKDDFRTDNVADYEACGVIDPLDDTVVTMKGRGRRLTLKGKNDKVLADLIIGRKKEGAATGTPVYFVREPGRKRVYAAKIDLDLSTKFSDWIETDLLKMAKDDIDKVVLQDYSIDEESRAVRHRDMLALTRNEQGVWQAADMGSDQEVNRDKMGEFLTTLDELTIVDVRRKPAGLSQGLSQADPTLTISQADAQSLQSKGYYFGSNGQLLSNEGELDCETRDGVRYILRFGEVASGSGRDDVGELSGQAAAPAENRYLFIATEFEAGRFPEPEKPADLAFKDKEEKEWSPADRENKRLRDGHEAWQERIEKGKKITEDLNARFADWYYVISAASFDKLHLTRADLLQKKEKKEAGKAD